MISTSFTKHLARAGSREIKHRRISDRFAKSFVSTRRVFSRRVVKPLLIIAGLALILPLVSHAVSSVSDPTALKRLNGSSVHNKHEKPESVPGELLVRFRPEASAGKASMRSEMNLNYGNRQISVQLERLNQGQEIVEGLRLARVAPQDMQTALQGFLERPDVIYAEPNFLRYKTAAPDDPRYNEQWALKNTGQFGTTAGIDIKAEEAWNVTTGSRNIVVGIVDEGIDINHPDLKDNVWTNTAEVAGNAVDDDGNGFVDDVNGWDFAHDDNTVFDYALPTYPPPEDYTLDIDDHGTHVAGIVGATGNNSTGVAGVNWQVSLLSFKFLTANGGSTANLLKALAYARMMRDLWQSSGGSKGANIRVLNNSYGGFGFSQSEFDAINALAGSNILFVAASGNAHVNNDVLPVYPAGYPLSNIISVGATHLNDAIAPFSDFGMSVHMAAPGVGILSTTPRTTYFFADGTSQASPFVAGAAALLWSANPQTSVDTMKSALVFNGKQIDSQSSLAGRRLDLNASLTALAENDTTAPAAIADFRISLQSLQNVGLQWTAPGDDGNVGRARLYEIRFSDSPFIDQQTFDQGRSLTRLFPQNAGSFESILVQPPFRHPSGFIGIRAVDNLGNKGAIVSVPFSNNPAFADPYTIQESVPQTLSTGGNALGLKGDDVFKEYLLPFSVPFFVGGNDRVTISSNGAISFSIPNPWSVPIGDYPGELISVRAMERRTLIAGLWDDLRTDRRPSDDVYVVPPDFLNPDRIIFRWQAVTYATLLGGGSSRGENPVNFEIELGRDGSVITRYGDGNQKVFPIVGISAGFDPYIATSHTSEAVLKDLTNAPAVIFSRRSPTPPQLRLVFASDSTVIRGQELAYAALADNSGPSVAEATVLDVTLSIGQTFLSCSGNVTCQGPPAGTNGGTVRMHFGPLAARTRGEGKLRVRVTANSGSTVTAEGRLSCARSDVNSLFGNASSKVVSDLFHATPFTGASQIAAGRSHGLVVRDGNVWAWGGNFEGQLGDGTTTNRSYAVQIQNLSSVVAVAAGWNFSMALKSDGTVWSWGSNGWGQLGDGSFATRSAIPVMALNATDVVAIAAGEDHAMFLKADGTVWAWGLNLHGILGIGTIDTARHAEPTKVPGLPRIRGIAAGNSYCLGIDDADGSLWGWGNNAGGTLGDGTTTQRPSPVHVSGLVGLRSIASHKSHNIAIAADSSVWSWGANSKGQLALGDTSQHLSPVQVPNMQAISAATGDGHTLLVKPDGTVWSCGSNNRGQLGIGVTDIGLTFPPHPEITQVNGISNAIAVEAGFESSFAIVSNNSTTSVRAWGSNEFSALGDGTSNTRPNPVAVVEDALAAPNAPNAIDSTLPFVRQHYLDFLNREPDTAGLQFWINNIDSCGSDSACREVKRIDTSAAYFLSIEFTETGYLVHRFYITSFGRRPLFTEFLDDTQLVSEGLIVNAPGWEQLLETNKRKLAGDFVARASFKSLYDILSNADFVDRLITNSGAILTSAERSVLVNGLNANTLGREKVLRQIAENQAVYNAHKNAAFVEMQYFGYLRRNPQDAPDNDLTGYNFWLDKLNEFGGDYRNAEMVKAFLISGEYRKRFGAP